LIHVILTGFMGTAKTAVGRRLAMRLRRVFLDLDELIEARQGRTIAEVFATDGEPEFRRIERQTVAGLAPDEPAVIATGGGTFADPENRRVLASLGVVVCLIASFDTIVERVGRNDKRPLASGPDADRRLRALLEQRMETYRKADVLVETDGLSVEQSTARVLAMVEPRLKAERPRGD